MSIREYARHRGCSPAAVRKAIRSGRITPRSDGRIDAVGADTEWRVNTRRTLASFGGGVSPARTVREHYLALLAKIDYEERTGTLVSAEAVQVATFNKFRRYRDAVLSIPDRVASMLAAESHVEVVRAVLVSEIMRALEDGEVRP